MKPLPFVAGLALFALPLVLESGLSHWGEHGAQPALAAALTLLMATWWITEALPIFWTACVPLLVLPFASVYGEGFGANLLGAFAPYVDPYIFLFLGGMGIAAAMQQWNLHRRIALQVMRVGRHRCAAAAVRPAARDRHRVAVDLEHRDRRDDVPDRPRADRRVRARERAGAWRATAPR